MVESINSRVDISVKGTSFAGTSNYGDILVGDKGFEFYNTRDYKKYIQIPWDEVECVIVSVLFKGKWIPRYAVKTKRHGTYIFASKETKKVLRTMREYVGANNIVKSLTFLQVLGRGLKNIFVKKIRL
ncbi:DUF956 family protein [uncultured Clostridium sp.]|jgi:hypothetical protein|uniref:DUF956 family protein n=1 Tax=uncultured Clostridium sp. TaxID=59620 RepID=UPI0026154C6D|nr:DUF956 family protein [uncultured Clostridium sp.]